VSYMIMCKIVQHSLVCYVLRLKVGRGNEKMGWKQVNARKKLKILQLKLGQGKEEMGWKQVKAIKRLKILRKWKWKIIKKIGMNFHFGSWEFWNVLKLWNKNGKGKPCVIQKWFVPLESFLNLDFENELTFSIWN
jgi:hypothetical protein